MPPYLKPRTYKVEMVSKTLGARPLSPPIPLLTSAELCVGMLVYKDNDGNLTKVAANTAVLGRLAVVQPVYENNYPAGQYKPANVAGFGQVECFSDGYYAIITEDGVGENINYPTELYINLVAQTVANTPSDLETVAPMAEALVQLDSSTGAASQTSESLYLLGPEDSVGNIGTNQMAWKVEPAANKLQTP